MATRNHQSAVFIPWRYGLFLLLYALTASLGLILPWGMVIMAGVDIAAIAFIATLPPLFRRDEKGMREHARANDANREVMLLVTGIVMVAILVTVATELRQKDAPSGAAICLILGTLAIAWLFSNIVYAMHYAFLYYSAADKGSDKGGIDFPGKEAPDYWDFIYFSFTLGMTFQTSDTDITSRSIRKVALFQSLAAFLFNLGILAFTINVLGS